ncbi:UNVERIFIED_CONTAM: hypothetical protein PYX00_005407 [Menopon gallinae]|uniref:Transforming acidic coiled-coil-containing protein C-terminal domain-containing protein n=1 Tax=Menopon gallinae TaxID=328185 RepID=A0AAW2HRE8_9NEOP
MDQAPISNSQNVVLDDKSAVTIPADDNHDSLDTVQAANSHQETDMNSTDLSTSHVPRQNDLNEIQCDYEDTHIENTVADNTVLKGILPISPGAPNIFENAVKVVKNLFSPAKGHGLFSRSIPLSTNSDPEVRRVLQDDANLQENAKKQEELTALECKSLSMNILQNASANEDTSGSSAKSSPCTVEEVHDNTNDSYTSTVSRMDDSFKSTLTHFEECIQKPEESMDSTNSSFNKSADGDESLLNNTLKNHSICSNEKEDSIFEVNDQIVAYNTCKIESKDNNEAVEDLNLEHSVVVTEEVVPDKFSNCLQLTEENLRQLEEQNFTDTSPGIVMNKNLTPEDENKVENTHTTDTSIEQAKDEDVLCQPPAKNQPSDSSVFSESNENFLAQKTDDLETNLSTTTVVLFKADVSKSTETVTFNTSELACSSKTSADREAFKNSVSANDIKTIYDGACSSSPGTEKLLNAEKTVVKELFPKNVEENNIPLALQKSYTVLHNVNPNLDRPVVVGTTSDVRNFNSIILGNTFSDLNVECDPGNPCLGGTTSTPTKEKLLVKTETVSLFKHEDVTREDVETKPPEPDISAQIDIHSDFDKNNQCEKENLDPNQGKFNKLEKPKSDSVLNVLHNSLNKTFEKTSESNLSGILRKTDTDPVNYIVNSSSTPKTPLLVQSFVMETSVGSVGGTGSNSTFTKEPTNSDENYAAAANNPTPIRRSDSPSNIESIIQDYEKFKLNDSLREDPLCNTSFEFNNNPFDTFGRLNDSLASADENSKKSPSMESELTQLIQEQFTPRDIEKICCVVEEMPELNLSKNILMASHMFDKSFQEKNFSENDNKEEFQNGNDLFAGLDYLESIKGKPGRDFSRESLYTKFDPLLQPKKSTELFDITEGDKENMNISKSAIVSEPLIAISPLKETINLNSPSSLKLVADKQNRIRELQNEISLLKESYQQKEEQNKEKVTFYENEILKMTAKMCHLQEKLKESEETEKSLVKKLNSHNESVNRLKGIVEEYFTYVEKLTEQIETAKRESHKQIAKISEERDYYMNHLQSTEQAFSDVHSKYEKCKKAVEMYKKNEEVYRASIDDLKERVEHYSEKIKEILENTSKEVGRLQEKMTDLKFTHSQEISRYKAQLKKTEIKVQSIQKALDQKVKENQELAGICDELIEGKKCSR